ncbi:hypothetical protein BJX62DRAFT_233947 [Aspergillus germanicus]
MRLASFIIPSALVAFSFLTGATTVQEVANGYRDDYGWPLRVTVLNSSVEDVPSTVQWVSKKNTFDAPKVVPMNSTTYQNWWFDAVTPDGTSTFTVNFLTTPANAAGLVPDGHAGAPILAILARLPNGTMVSQYLSASAAAIASGAAAGTWLDTGAKFRGTPSLRDYYVDIDTTKLKVPSVLKVKGSLHYRSLTPAHYPCGTTLDAGQDLQVFPHLGWTNTMAGASVSGSMTIEDQKLTFRHGEHNIGYHDMNWGDGDFTAVAKSWFWGHFTLGPYTVALWDGVGTGDDAQEFTTAYVANDGNVVASGCGPDKIRVRPVDGTWPEDLQKATAYEITVPLPGEADEIKAVSTLSGVQDVSPFSTRGAAKLAGTVGAKSYTGIGMFEAFSLP